MYIVWPCRPDKKLASHFLKFGWMCVLSILLISKCRGTVSKALLMSIVAISVREAGLAELRPSSVVCVMFVSSVDVECCGLKPCCEGDSVMCGVMLFRTSLSSIFDGLLRSDMGLYEAGSVGVLLGFRMGIILASFQVLGILLFVSEKLKMFVRVLMACGPRCLRCRYDIPSGPVEVVFFVRLMASTVMAVVNGAGRFLSSVSVWRRWRIARSSRLCGSLDMFE